MNDNDHPRPHWHASDPKFDDKGLPRVGNYNEWKCTGGGLSVPY
jgi:hypothetical protein